MSSVEEIARKQVTGNLGSHLSPLILGMAVDGLLMGVAINQFVRWWNHSKKEATHIRFLLYLASFGAICATIFTWATTLHMFSYNYGEYSQFIKCDWIAWYGILDPLTKISIQAFYAERAWRINKRNYVILVSIGICLCLSVTGSVGYTFITRTKTMNDFDSTANIFFYLWPGACISADLIITSSIMYGLYRSRSGLDHTDRLVKRLMRISLEAQVPPTLVALLFFLQFAADSMSSIVQFIAIIHPKVYLVGCLAVLNSREDLRNDRKTSYVYTSGGSYGSSSAGSGNKNLQTGGITVETETYICSDGGLVVPRPGLNRSFSDIKDKDLSSISLDSQAHADAEAIALAERGGLGTPLEFEVKLQ
ncbi:hypothetical protein I302_109113 [Kwoniella bestiolae CBS 10118]|uniref:DUF6534 domain-containing protein n=1 Tax=Kwoniella bestiolae CBS 10118 TaxID=1296100 RepID=A0A1B9FV08_9TREE|nr:hypothetical protein I302_08258 [Kwoniella bestiolae CBS 10118]OCF22607.1 hypothetical protein I302_08258 [Kwoniella bestiolae CBS 10118]